MVRTELMLWGCLLPQTSEVLTVGSISWDLSEYIAVVCILLCHLDALLDHWFLDDKFMFLGV